MLQDIAIFGKPFRWFWPLCLLGQCNKHVVCFNDDGTWLGCTYCLRKRCYEKHINQHFDQFRK